ncbi:uncharacterized protein LOC109615055 [Esox lucius]|uniref:uncharacterized protein LOC109615055 n=1 Tax=Esox lucius TaxID=8010 RepID=UPI001476E34B|nr:uncharacterized protein LOC109615055 [Esox lucius]
MTDKSKCTTIYMSRELRRASEKSLSTGCQETRFPEYTSALRVNNTHSHHWSLGIRRSFASTDLLANAHPQSAHSTLSLNSLEGVLSLHSDSKVEIQPTDDAALSPWSSRGSRLSLDDITLSAGGEGTGSDRKRCADSRDNCVDAKGSCIETPCLEDDEDSGSLQYEEEDEEEEGGGEEDDEEEEEEEEASGVVLMPEARKKNKHDVERTSTKSPSKYLQEFHSLPKSLVPSEITHCLYELEEECRGVERESESVKWKMELIHGSVLTVQETLRTLLIRLVEAQSSRAFDPTPKPTNHRFPSTSHHRHPQSHGHTSHAPTYWLAQTHSPAPSTTPAARAELSQESRAHSRCDHHRCLAVARRPSETCLTEAAAAGTTAPCHCCPKATSPGTVTMDTPSCAQRGKERAAALHAISELRTDVERLRVAHEEGRQELQETLEVMRALQKDMGTLVSQCQKDKQEGQKWNNPMAKLEAIRKQSKSISEMTRQAVAVFGKVGLHVDGKGAVTPQVHSDSTKLKPNSSLLGQHCTSNDGEISEE